jgi:hypothetical protein
VLRFGRYVRLTEERLARAESFFTHYGGKIVIVARFIEGLPQANGIIAGITPDALAEVPRLGRSPVGGHLDLSRLPGCCAE